MEDKQLDNELYMEECEIVVDLINYQNTDLLACL